MPGHDHPRPITEEHTMGHRIARRSLITAALAGTALTACTDGGEE